MPINTFQNEQNEVLSTLLNTVFVDLWGKNFLEQKEILQELPIKKSEFFLEIFVTGSCNQKCEYCYLNNYGDKLYPKELQDSKLILSNLEILLNYCIENNFQISRLDLFSGEIWGYPLGNKVFDCLLAAIDRGLCVGSIVIPSNCSFCTNPELKNIVNEYIYRFLETNTQIAFSISMDGLVVDKLSRPFSNEHLEKTEQYYKEIVAFAKEHHYGFHPMISSESIEHQKENYEAWLKIGEELYGKENAKKKFGFIMQLEVRNDGWTKEKIVSYLDWLNYLLDTDFNYYFHKDLNLLAKFLIRREVIPEFSESFNSTYIPYMIYSDAKTYSCTLGSMLCIRLGDLAICPCHRTAYEKFLLGKFKVNNGKITGIEANNIQLANTIYRTTAYTKPKCDICFWNDTCIKGCLGSQYESTGEILYPVESVCNLEIAKTIFLLEKYKQMGILNLTGELKNINPNLYKLYSHYKETKEYVEWNSIIQKILSEN